MDFPINLDDYKPLNFNLSNRGLSHDQRLKLIGNIQLVRDSIIFFTAFANTKGLGGHTGGAYDIVPELLIIDGFMKGTDTIYPVYFDEAGHRVAIQYIMIVLNRYMKPKALLHYREVGKGLYGHPERNDERGIFFSSGRLGHLWSYVNGIAQANPRQKIILFGSDGSQQEGNDAEAARYAVANNLNVKLLIDDNDVTIAGHPSLYLNGFDVAQTLRGHGLFVDSGDGENVDQLYQRIRTALTTDGPYALVNNRLMAPGVEGIQGSSKGHDVIPVELATHYLKARGYKKAVEMLQQKNKKHTRPVYMGSTEETAKNRDNFGKIICDILRDMPDKKNKVLVVDSDLEGSCGLHHIHKEFPEIYVMGGIMERNNLSVTAGFGSAEGRQGIFGTFSAFLEMVISEITMARLNKANVLCHFSHAGVDDMADNTCHFGINNFFADNGLLVNDCTRLYYPADSNQMRAIVEAVFNDPGLRFIFSTRSATPFILNESGEQFFKKGYQFIPGRDEIVRQGKDGYVITYGEMLYRCLDAIECLKAENIHVGLINKPTLNIIDEGMMEKLVSQRFVLVVETQNIKTGLGTRFGTWLLERGYNAKYAQMSTIREGEGGLSEQIDHQGLGAEEIEKKIKALIQTIECR
jgi:transketolase C-terminal domain/subunit/transketolase N-terminal domain/subunit